MTGRLCASGWRVTLGLLLAAGLVGGCGEDGESAGDDAGRGGRDTSVTPDAGGEGDTVTTPDTNQPPARESVHVVGIRQSVADDSRQMVVLEDDCRPRWTGINGLCDPGDCTPSTVVAGSGFTCEAYCAASPNLDWVVWSAGTTLRLAPLGTDFQVASEGIALAEEPLQVQLLDDRVVWRVGNDVFQVRYGETTPEKIYTFVPPERVLQPGSFAASPDGSRLFVLQPLSLASMEARLVDLSGPSERALHTFAIDGLDAGSFFQGAEPISFSPDGSRVAIVTTAPRLFGTCGDVSACGGQPGARCYADTFGHGRCMANRLTTWFFNVDAADRLGQGCGSDGDCGEDHACDTGASAPVCIPRPVDLGPQGQQFVVQGGTPTTVGECQTYRPGDYTRMRPSMGWRADGAFLMLGMQECQTVGIKQTEVVALSGSPRTASVVLSNPATGFGQCLNSLDQCYDDDDCVIEADRMALSPGGTRIALVADGVTSERASELWLADPFARRGKGVMTRDISWLYREVSIHRRAE